MKNIFRYIIVLFSILSVFPISAYEIETHGFITYEAYKRSSLATDASLLDDLGIENSDDVFGNSYYDVDTDNSLSQPIQERNSHNFENKIIKNFIKQDILSLQGWLMRGAIREDDVPFGENPKDDPINAFRVFNHFYDPVYDRPLTVLGKILGDKAPGWAFGTFDFTTSPIQDNRFINHYTLFDAQDAMYRALTGRDKNGNTEIGASGEQVATKAIRQAYWATTFRVLGDVVHLMQDMAQPQHTRNDRHDPLSSDERQVYEEYTNSRALNVEFEKCFDGEDIPIDSLKYTFGPNPYPIPKFNKYGEFFTTNPGSTTGGKGLADFSNHNFFSEGTNNPNGESGEYLYPSNNNFTFSESTYADPCLVRDNAKLITLTAEVVDQKTGLSNPDVSLSTRSLWDHPDADFPLPKYVLAKENYIAMANLLIPRAVSYSAGLINYFFRGRLQVLQASKLGNELTLRFKNVSAKDLNNNGITFTEGKFEVFYEDINGIMQPLTVISSDLPSGDTTVATGDNMLHDTTYTFTLTHPVEDNIALAPYTDTSGNKLGTNTPFVLVFRGQIGQDAGIAAITFARDGLLAYYGIEDSSTSTTSLGYELRVVSNPTKAWREFSLGPDAPKTGFDPGWITNLGNNQLTLSGGYATSGTTPPPPRPPLFRSLDGGRSFVKEDDFAPTPNDGPYPKSYLPYTASVFTGGTSLATLRFIDKNSSNNTNSYRFHQSDDLGQTWASGGIIINLADRLSSLIYLGEINGLKKYVAIAKYRQEDEAGNLIGIKWSLLKSNDSGQTFDVQPINEVVTYSPFTGATTALLVNMGTDVTGNSTLGLAIMEGVVTGENAEAIINFYKSTNSGVSWSLVSKVPRSPRITTGKFPLTVDGLVRDLLYLGTPEGGEPNLYLSITQRLTFNNKDAQIKEFFLSTDAGLSWVATPGPDLGIINHSDREGNVYEVMSKFPWLVYPLDNGAIPGLYD